MTPTWMDLISQDAHALIASEIRDLLKLTEQPEMISFAGGVPDPLLFPLDEFRDVYSELLQDTHQARRTLQYSISEGLPSLRQWIQEELARENTAVNTQQILITNGAQQGLDMLARLLLESGRPLVVEKPSYLGALQAFSSRRPTLIGIDLDDHGPRLDQLERAFAEGARLAYLAPDFQNPTGRCYSTERRQAILALARRYGAALIEDAAYAKLHYHDDPKPSLLALDRADQPSQFSVIQLGTFSKTLAPALRIGWLVAPEALIERLVLMKQASDLHVSTINQEIAQRMASRVLEHHLPRLRNAYRAKRDLMLTALTDNLPDTVHWTRPEGGMFCWLTLPEQLDSRRILEQTLKQDAVAFVPGQAFFCDQSGQHTLRLSFVSESDARIREGIYRLAERLRQNLASAL